ncbi:hypothetical protein [Acetobacter aceti]|nr:hypothetical protein [Acetobacter aceti]
MSEGAFSPNPFGLPGLHSACEELSSVKSQTPRKGWIDLLGGAVCRWPTLQSSPLRESRCCARRRSGSHAPTKRLGRSFSFGIPMAVVTIAMVMGLWALVNWRPQRSEEALP